MSRFEKYGCSPIIFYDDEKRKEWEEMDPILKKSALAHIHETSKRLGIEMSIEMLCNVVMDMQKRIDELEKKIAIGGKM